MVNAAEPANKSERITHAYLRLPPRADQAGIINIFYSCRLLKSEIGNVVITKADIFYQPKVLIGGEVLSSPILV